MHGSGVESFIRDVNKLKKQKMVFYRPIDLIELKLSLFKSICMPELAKGIRFVLFF